MKTPTEYTIVAVPFHADAATHEELTRKVNENLSGGYELYGPAQNESKPICAIARRLQSAWCVLSCRAGCIDSISVCAHQMHAFVP
jgi:hypothetical protein